VFASGAAQGSHLWFAKNAATWVAFYESDADPMHLRTRVSKDFVTWTDGASLALPHEHPHDGRSFAVSYADVAGRDVFHLAVSLKPGSSDRRHTHVRATFSGGALVFEAVSELSRTLSTITQLEPDGPAVAILPAGTVLDVSGWYSAEAGTSVFTGNMIAWNSAMSGTAATWAPDFAGPVEVESVPKFCNARALAPTPTGAVVLWEAADTDPNPTGIRFAAFATGTWAAPGDVSFKGATFDPNDWAVTSLGADVHAIRAASSDFSHRIYTAGTWRAGKPVPTRAHPAGQGVVLVNDEGVVRAFTLDADGTVASTSLAGVAWSPWKVELPPGPRTRLTGYAGAGGLGVMWSEQNGSRNDLVAARLH
jgi:hypothetical protein